MGDLTRRRIVAVAASLPASVLAGCTMLESDEEPEGEDEETENGTGTETGTETANSSDEDTGSDDESADDNPETAQELADVFAADLLADRYERASERFSPDLQSDQLVANLERMSMGLTNAGGAYEGLGETTEEVYQGHDTILAALEFERVDAAPIRLFYDDDYRLLEVVFAGEYTTPSYVDTDAFDEREIELETEGCPIEGTLTVPTGATNVPGVVLVHGSGPTDRDATIGANKPFRDLAEGLATNGIAVLRYDKRTFQCHVDAVDATFDRITVSDTLVALERLREVDAVGDVFVSGLSLGGYAVPRIAERAENLAGAIALAAPARPLPDVFVEQYEYLVEVGTHTPETNEQELTAATRMAEQIRAGEFEDDEMLFQESGAFWADIADYDPVETATEVETPLSFLQGGRDYQVSPDADFGRWQTELAERPNTAFQRYDRLDHLFLPGEGDSVPEEYFVPQSVDEAVVEDISTWIEEG